MPIYVYQVLTPAGDGPIFEAMQRLDEPPLTQRPNSGEPVCRVITAPNLPLKHGPTVVKNQLAPANLAKHGFIRYEREGQGRYVKTAGDPTAPKILTPT